MSTLDHVFDANFCWEAVAATASSLFNTCIRQTDKQHITASVITVLELMK